MPKASAYSPERGDIVYIDFDPTKGHEQAKTRPALVLSPGVFNKQIKLALVAPITSRVRGHGFEVVIDGDKTTGVVLCQQVRTVDYDARHIEFIEKGPANVIREVLSKVKLLVS
jgi:mRNA interferase MazF